jgi:hypothetical protein
VEAGENRTAEPDISSLEINNIVTPNANPRNFYREISKLVLKHNNVKT